MGWRAQHSLAFLGLAPQPLELGLQVVVLDLDHLRLLLLSAQLGFLLLAQLLLEEADLPLQVLMLLQLGCCLPVQHRLMRGLEDVVSLDVLQDVVQVLFELSVPERAVFLP
jgi:hypothetical protein